MSKISEVIFKAYDIRGVVDKTLTLEAARAVGQALGSLAREKISALFAWAVTADFPARNSQKHSLKALPTWVLMSNPSA